MSVPLDQPAPSDQPARDAAIDERARNVVIDAGAGTGKTTTVVRRLVAMLAPSAPALPAMAIDRIAAVTFTRRAAGELRLRLREELQRRIASPPSDVAASRLRAALEGLDTAHIGTIHSFADRLLRLHPVEARLSPTYEIAEDDEILVQETYERLLRAVEARTLVSDLAGSVSEPLLEAAQEAFSDAIESGVRLEKQDLEYMVKEGLDSLIEAFIRRRDVPPRVAEVTLDDAAMRAFMQEFIELAATLSDTYAYARLVKRVAGQVEDLLQEKDPRRLFRYLVPAFERLKRRKPQKKDCKDELEVYEASKAILGDRRKNPVRTTALADDITSPLRGWLAQQLVNAFPVVIALYEQVKGRYGLIDNVDLLLQLRDLLRDNKQVRAAYQQMFDHIFVDEFQDTDPLQAEILLFLCEDGAAADVWSDVALAPGKLTIVGDAKQSIYRFRRADVAMYDRVRTLILKDALSVRLGCNFRSTHALIDWLNDRMGAVLEEPPADAPFDADTGQVFHQPLSHGRDDAGEVPVHVVAYDVVGETTAPPTRRFEGLVLTDYIRWLVDHSGHQIRDPETEALRGVQLGDIAVLTISTFFLRFLTSKLDAAQIPHTVSGGVLFATDPLHMQFILGLRALADRDDGVAQAALMRPPFFALDLADHASWKARADNDATQRVEAAREVVTALRRERFNRGPGATARALLEETGFGRFVALGPNGEQRIARLREVCLLLEEIARNERVDFDAATAKLRSWLATPPRLDAPRPIDADVVQIMTIHQSKGLEFPVVILWDGMAKLAGSTSRPPWRTDPTGNAWAIHLDRFNHAHPPQPDLAAIEKDYLQHERRRLIYVACTRARDLVVLPRPAAAGGKHISSLLAQDAEDLGGRVLDAYTSEKASDWAASLPELEESAFRTDEKLPQTVEKRWEQASRASAQPRLSPVWVSEVRPESDTLVGTDDDPPFKPPRKSRFGTDFGNVVHGALELLIHANARDAAEAVRRVSSSLGITQQLDEATNDVSRTAATLRELNMLGPEGPSLRVEYAIGGVGQSGELLIGTIDLVGITDDEVTVIDFKTDQPPEGDIMRSHPKYVAQIQTYVRLLQDAGITGERNARCGLLFTADGRVRWVTGNEHHG